MLGKTQNIAHAGTPEAVDRLRRVTDRRHRMALTEQPLKQHPLPDPGVLILIEEHNPVGGAFGSGDHRLSGELRRERDLVAVVQQQRVALRLLESVDEREQLQPDLRLIQSLPRFSSSFRISGHHGLHLPGGHPDLRCAGEMRGHLIGKLTYAFGDAGRQQIDLERAVPAANHRHGQLPAQALGRQPGLRLDADAQPMVSEQARTVAVVGQNNGLAVELRQRERRPARRRCQLAQSLKPCAHSRRQRRGRFGGEGQTKHFLRPDLPAGDEMHDPGGHHLGLSRACAGED